MNHSLSELCKQTDTMLWQAWARSTKAPGAETLTGKLLFPCYREMETRKKETTRVSEQEARIAFIETLQSSSFLYAVEAPTSRAYQFTGKSPLSARTDLAIYESLTTRIGNVEFKAKGMGLSRKKQETIQQDIQKLILEPVPGIWFHLLESVNNSSINNKIQVLSKNIQQALAENASEIASNSLIIHLCVLKHGFSLQTEINPKTSSPAATCLSPVDLTVSRDQLISVQNTSGWALNRY